MQVRFAYYCYVYVTLIPEERRNWSNDQHVHFVVLIYLTSANVWLQEQPRESVDLFLMLVFDLQ